MVMNEETSYTVYEAIDFVKETMTAEQLAEYLWMNYPVYAEVLAGEITARLYLLAMEENPSAFQSEKGE